MATMHRKAYNASNRDKKRFLAEALRNEDGVTLKPNALANLAKRVKKSA